MGWNVETESKCQQQHEKNKNKQHKKSIVSRDLNM